MAFSSLKDILPRRLKQAGIERDVSASRVVLIANELLNDIFGSQTTADKAKAVALKFGQLSIATTSASLRQELRFSEKDFVKKINDSLGKPQVKRLRFLV